MAKSVKTIVQKMGGKILSTREASRLAQNERRKAQRRLARILTEETGKKVTWKEAYNTAKSLSSLSDESKALSKTIESLTSKNIEGSKQKRGYSVSIEREAESLKTFTYLRFGRETLSKKGDAPDLFRRNEMFTHQINQSTRKEGLSALKSNETHGFYAATQWIWNGASASDNRNAMIMQEFGLSDLQQVYDLIVKKELKPSDFGFKVSDEDWEKYKNEEIEATLEMEMFEDWLDEIRERVDIDKLREVFHEEINVEKDEPEVKYSKFAIANIRMKTAKMKRHG